MKTTINKCLFDGYLWCERKLAGLSPKQLITPDGTFAYLEGGKGSTILLLHGFGANKDNWNKLAKYLTRDFHVIAVDLPGFGHSYHDPEASYGLADQLMRLLTFVQHKQLTDVMLAGNSYGGYLAANFAAQHPERIRTLLLLNPLGVAGAKHSEVFNCIAAGGHNALLPGNQKEYAFLLQKCFYKVPYLPDFAIEQLTREATSNPSLKEKIFFATHQRSGNNLIFEGPLEQVLKTYSGPIVVYWGTEDKILHVDGGRVLKREVEHIKLVEFEKIGHLPMLEAPGTMAREIEKAHHEVKKRT
ncbi:alpha/beta fold hydrolase [Endozoicomonas sp.]|uniref:alpha/beta fold hydrolase n=1 Tax=Endozoicomonas sp. TaxID=1892382 RepID=UPI003AF764BC